MTRNFHIEYVGRDKINDSGWNKCIDEADNGLIYGYTFYLDHMARHWDALVLNDYEAVMPLTWNKKYGISYLYQPFLTAQLGVFGKNVTAEVVEAFLTSIPAKFRYWDIYLNHGNIFSLTNFQLYQRANYVLDLNKSYDQIRNSYRQNIIRNTRKAEQSGCHAARGIDAEEVIQLAIQQMKSHSSEWKENVTRFRTLYKFLFDKGMAMTYAILSPKEQLLSSCIFFSSHGRAYYILVGNHADGRTLGSSHALIDSFIKQHAGTPVLLDFEGSDIPNLASFYSSFGAEEESFAGVKRNRLPWLLKLLK